MTPLFLIDYSNYCYRFSSSYKFSVEIKNVKVSTSILFGYVRALKANIFKDIIICLDGDPQINMRYLPQYKGQRLKEPNESHSVPRLELVKFLTKIGDKIGKNIKVAASPFQEADQVMASIVKQATNQVDSFTVEMSNYSREHMSADWRLSSLTKGAIEKELTLDGYDMVILGTTDSDMYQLLENDNVRIDMSTCGQKLDDGSFTPKAIHHLPPAAIPAYKAICGDISDNVPSLQLPYDLKVMVKLIANHLNTKEALHKFITACEKANYSDIDKSLIPLAKHIVNTGQVSQLRINNRVTELTFLSTPRFLDYPDYDIMETIKKYKIKI